MVRLGRAGDRRGLCRCSLHNVQKEGTAYQEHFSKYIIFCGRVLKIGN